jgi:hypothetical protein
MFAFLHGQRAAKGPITAREAVHLARSALRERSPEAFDPVLCNVYTAPEDSTRELCRDGRCRSWHVDFYEARQAVHHLVRVVDEKARVRVRPRKATPVEYVFALYDGADSAPELEGEWVDSTIAAAVALAALERELIEEPQEILDDYFLLALMLPAQHLRYLQEGQAVTLSPPPDGLHYAVLLGHVDVEDHPVLAVYVDANRGEECHCEHFHFPALTMVGVSRDW